MQPHDATLDMFARFLHQHRTGVHASHALNGSILGVLAFPLVYQSENERHIVNPGIEFQCGTRGHDLQLLDKSGYNAFLSPTKFCDKI